MTPLMTATSLSKQFVLGGGFLSAGKGSQRLTALDDVSLHIGKGEIVGVVGEFRLREVDTRPGRGAAERSQRRQARIPRPRPHLGAGRALSTAPSPSVHPDGFPGPLIGIGSSLEGAGCHRRASCASQAHDMEGRTIRGRAGRQIGRPASGTVESFPAPVIGRSKGASWHSQGDCPGSRADRPGRTDVLARCFGAVCRASASGGTQAAAATKLSLHIPRPQSRSPVVRSRPGHVSGTCRRIRPGSANF